MKVLGGDFLIGERTVRNVDEILRHQSAAGPSPPVVKGWYFLAGLAVRLAIVTYADVC